MNQGNLVNEVIIQKLNSLTEGFAFLKERFY